jgi:hypothetical protein
MRRRRSPVVLTVIPERPVSCMRLKEYTVATKGREQEKDQRMDTHAWRESSRSGPHLRHRVSHEVLCALRACQPNNGRQPGICLRGAGLRDMPARLLDFRHLIFKMAPVRRADTMLRAVWSLWLRLRSGEHVRMSLSRPMVRSWLVRLLRDIANGIRVKKVTMQMLAQNVQQNTRCSLFKNGKEVSSS